MKLFKYELLSEKVYKTLKESIITRELLPGTKLLENDLAKKMGISRTPVREAFHKLAAEDFIRLIPNQGGIVTDVSTNDLKEVLELRCALDALASRLAIENINESFLDSMSKIIEEMEKLVTENNINEYIVRDEQFHRLIIENTKNKRLIKIMDNLNDQIRRFRIKSLYIPERLKHSFSDHKKIFNAIKEKNIKKAEELSYQHVRNVLENVVKNKIQNNLNKLI